ncbi:hypothetical protein [Nonomuraea sp. NPDC023979]|uniref:hypothetical protein n=1 Tax=Nonomuraea sp. NPDC023979 TaxID=3154796 RepID=UPI0033EFC135
MNLFGRNRKGREAQRRQIPLTEENRPEIQKVALAAIKSVHCTGEYGLDVTQTPSGVILEIHMLYPWRNDATRAVCTALETFGYVGRQTGDGLIIITGREVTGAQPDTVEGVDQQIDALLEVRDNLMRNR